MKLSYASAKSALAELLGASEMSVIALTGAWGTGKSHLWSDVRGAIWPNFSKSESATCPIYVSLFGARSIGELKLRIIQSTYLADESRLKAVVALAAKGARGFLGRWTGENTLNDLVFLSLPKLLEGRLIVIDDVERKHAALEIDEILGLINECSENYRSRFLLLLNTEKLKEQDDEVWRELHEKVIDAEVVLDPEPGEAFDLASGSIKHLYAAEIRRAVEVLDINNIRVIRKILRLSDRMFRGHQELSPTTMARLAPSSALLAAMHYRAISNPPSWEYVKNLNAIPRIHVNGETRPEVEAHWDVLLTRLGVQLAGPYEELVMACLMTGAVDEPARKTILKNLEAESGGEKLRSELDELREAIYWNSSFSEEEVLQKIRNHLKSVASIDPARMTMLANAAMELGDEALSRQMVEEWVTELHKSSDALSIAEHVEDSARRSQLHPEISKAFSQIREKRFPPLSIDGAVLRMVRNSGWGKREEHALQSSSQEGYIESLKRVQGEELALFIQENFSYLKTEAPMPYIKIAADNFVAASKATCTDEPNSRLSKILQREFASWGMSALLSSNQVSPPDSP